MGEDSQRNRGWLTMDGSAELGQRLNQVANGTFAHAGIAVEDVFAIAQREEGREEARRRARIADE